MHHRRSLRKRKHRMAPASGFSSHSPLRYPLVINAANHSAPCNLPLAPLSRGAGSRKAD
nr:MAG TPA: hypothetical protein [Caudoviricetes sp.]